MTTSYGFFLFCSLANSAPFNRRLPLSLPGLTFHTPPTRLQSWARTWKRKKAVVAIRLGSLHYAHLLSSAARCRRAALGCSPPGFESARLDARRPTPPQLGHRAAARARLAQGDSARIDKFQQSVAAAETGLARFNSHAARLDSQLKNDCWRNPARQAQSIQSDRPALTEH